MDFFDFKRPLNSDTRKIKKELTLALKNFLALEIEVFPYEIKVNPSITLMVHGRAQNERRLFIVGGDDDKDAGGWVISVYIENIRHCIAEKSLKIKPFITDYSEWWLYLVDHMVYGLDEDDLKEVVLGINNTGSFDKVVILNYEGKFPILDMAKNAFQRKR